MGSCLVFTHPHPSGLTYSSQHSSLPAIATCHSALPPPVCCPYQSKNVLRKSVCISENPTLTQNSTPGKVHSTPHEALCEHSSLTLRPHILPPHSPTDTGLAGLRTCSTWPAQDSLCLEPSPGFPMPGFSPCSNVLSSEKLCLITLSKICTSVWYIVNTLSCVE